MRKISLACKGGLLTFAGIAALGCSAVEAQAGRDKNQTGRFGKGRL